ncbi:MAG TPA: penicillin-binding transpeptidase domain-containing protein, partial [Candidatus Limnocylindria bacterium]|nr:penicillin-binding transpeptidase domain-containing protein [Candidatus Limnocylindria bacterium]
MSRSLAVALAFVTIAGCTSAEPDGTPYPTPVPLQSVDDAPAAVDAFLTAWRSGRFTDMYAMLTEVDRARVAEADFVDLLETFNRLTGAQDLEWRMGSIQPISLPATSAGAAGPVGPIPALRVPMRLRMITDLFGEIDMPRDLLLVAGATDWELKWSAAVVFPELGENGSLRLRRQEPTRGQIRSQDGTVFARTRDDGLRVYPQEWLAGQTIGYATPATRQDVAAGARPGLRRGELVGRSGLELGADELLAGSPGYTLMAYPANGEPVAVAQRRVVDGANVTITLRPDIQATADAAIAGYNEAGTAVIDPRNGDVWALSSAPLFNPNSMTIGTTVGGTPLAAPSDSARLNHATLAAYPAGSSFKVFTLAAALKIGVASPATRMTCNGTWPFSGFTFRNYEEHSLPGLVDLLQAMAFSCNTTYMPLSIMVYDQDTHVLTDLIREFGFGQSTGMEYLADTPGILPDHQYFESTKRWDDVFRPYGPFDQIQLAIGQGSYLGTPLQLANAYAAIGNGGKLWVPRIVVEARLPGGTLVERNRRALARRISLRAGHLDYVVDSMQAVVNYSYGTAYGPFIGFGIPVAGKSGTAETGGPDPDAWFPAIAPA